jgi:hypothetical protein
LDSDIELLKRVVTDLHDSLLAEALLSIEAQLDRLLAENERMQGEMVESGISTEDEGD